MQWLTWANYPYYYHCVGLTVMQRDRKELWGLQQSTGPAANRERFPHPGWELRREIFLPELVEIWTRILALYHSVAHLIFLTSKWEQRVWQGAEVTLEVCWNGQRWETTDERVTWLDSKLGLLDSCVLIFLLKPTGVILAVDYQV